LQPPPPLVADAVEDVVVIAASSVADVVVGVGGVAFELLRMATITTHSQQVVHSVTQLNGVAEAGCARKQARKEEDS
jgi:hypothetical protein